MYVGPEPPQAAASVLDGRHEQHLVVAGPAQLPLDPRHRGGVVSALTPGRAGSTAIYSQLSSSRSPVTRSGWPGNAASDARTCCTIRGTSCCVGMCHRSVSERVKEPMRVEIPF
jgi:hypothetical protein